MMNAQKNKRMEYRKKCVHKLANKEIFKPALQYNVLIPNLTQNLNSKCAG